MSFIQQQLLPLSMNRRNLQHQACSVQLGVVVVTCFIASVVVDRSAVFGDVSRDTPASVPATVVRSSRPNLIEQTEGFMDKKEREAALANHRFDLAIHWFRFITDYMTLISEQLHNLDN